MKTTRDTTLEESKGNVEPLDIIMKQLASEFGKDYENIYFGTTKELVRGTTYETTVISPEDKSAAELEKKIKEKITADSSREDIGKALGSLCNLSPDQTEESDAHWIPKKTALGSPTKYSLYKKIKDNVEKIPSETISALAKKIFCEIQYQSKIEPIISNIPFLIDQEKIIKRHLQTSLLTPTHISTYMRDLQSDQDTTITNALSNLGIKVTSAQISKIKDKTSEKPDEKASPANPLGSKPKPDSDEIKASKAQSHKEKKTEEKTFEENIVDKLILEIKNDKTKLPKKESLLEYELLQNQGLYDGIKHLQEINTKKYNIYAIIKTAVITQLINKVKADKIEEIEKALLSMWSTQEPDTAKIHSIAQAIHAFASVYHIKFGIESLNEAHPSGLTPEAKARQTRAQAELERIADTFKAKSETAASEEKLKGPAPSDSDGTKKSKGSDTPDFNSGKPGEPTSDKPQVEVGRQEIPTGSKLKIQATPSPDSSTGKIIIQATPTSIKATIIEPKSKESVLTGSDPSDSRRKATEEKQEEEYFPTPEDVTNQVIAELIKLLNSKFKKELKETAPEFNSSSDIYNGILTVVKNYKPLEGSEEESIDNMIQFIALTTQYLFSKDNTAELKELQGITSLPEDPVNDSLTKLANAAAQFTQSTLAQQATPYNPTKSLTGDELYDHDSDDKSSAEAEKPKEPDPSKTNSETIAVSIDVDEVNEADKEIELHQPAENKEKEAKEEREKAERERIETELKGNHMKAREMTTLVCEELKKQLKVSDDKQQDQWKALFSDDKAFYTALLGLIPEWSYKKEYKDASAENEGEKAKEIAGTLIQLFATDPTLNLISISTQTIEKNLKDNYSIAPLINLAMIHAALAFLSRHPEKIVVADKVLENVMHFIIEERKNIIDGIFNSKINEVKALDGYTLASTKKDYHPDNFSSDYQKLVDTAWNQLNATLKAEAQKDNFMLPDSFDINLKEEFIKLLQKAKDAKLPSEAIPEIKNSLNALGIPEGSEQRAQFITQLQEIHRATTLARALPKLMGELKLDGAKYYTDDYPEKFKASVTDIWKQLYGTLKTADVTQFDEKTETRFITGLAGLVADEDKVAPINEEKIKSKLKDHFHPPLDEKLFGAEAKDDSVGIDKIVAQIIKHREATRDQRDQKELAKQLETALNAFASKINGDTIRSVEEEKLSQTKYKGNLFTDPSVDSYLQQTIKLYPRLTAIKSIKDSISSEVVETRVKDLKNVEASLLNPLLKSLLVLTRSVNEINFDCITKALPLEYKNFTQADADIIIPDLIKLQNLAKQSRQEAKTEKENAVEQAVDLVVGKINDAYKLPADRYGYALDEKKTDVSSRYTDRESYDKEVTEAIKSLLPQLKDHYSTEEKESRIPATLAQDLAVAIQPFLTQKEKPTLDKKNVQGALIKFGIGDVDTFIVKIQAINKKAEDTSILALQAQAAKLLSEKRDITWNSQPIIGAFEQKYVDSYGPKIRDRLFKPIQELLDQGYRNKDKRIDSLANEAKKIADVLAALESLTLQPEFDKEKVETQLGHLNSLLKDAASIELSSERKEDKRKVTPEKDTLVTRCAELHKIALQGRADHVVCELERELKKSVKPVLKFAGIDPTKLTTPADYNFAPILTAVNACSDELKKQWINALASERKSGEEIARALHKSFIEDCKIHVTKKDITDVLTAKKVGLSETKKVDLAETKKADPSKTMEDGLPEDKVERLAEAISNANLEYYIAHLDKFTKPDQTLDTKITNVEAETKAAINSAEEECKIIEDALQGGDIPKWVTDHKTQIKELKESLSKLDKLTPQLTENRNKLNAIIIAEQKKKPEERDQSKIAIQAALTTFVKDQETLQTTLHEQTKKLTEAKEAIDKARQTINPELLQFKSLGIQELYADLEKKFAKKYTGAEGNYKYNSKTGLYDTKAIPFVSISADDKKDDDERKEIDQKTWEGRFGVTQNRKGFAGVKDNIKRQIYQLAGEHPFTALEKGVSHLLTEAVDSTVDFKDYYPTDPRTRPNIKRQFSQRQAIFDLINDINENKKEVLDKPAAIRALRDKLELQVVLERKQLFEHLEATYKNFHDLLQESKTRKEAASKLASAINEIDRLIGDEKNSGLIEDRKKAEKQFDEKVQEKLKVIIGGEYKPNKLSFSDDAITQINLAKRSFEIMRKEMDAHKDKKTFTQSQIFTPKKADDKNNFVDIDLADLKKYQQSAINLTSLLTDNPKAVVSLRLANKPSLAKVAELPSAVLTTDKAQASKVRLFNIDQDQQIVDAKQAISYSKFDEKGDFTSGAMIELPEHISDRYGLFKFLKAMEEKEKNGWKFFEDDKKIKAEDLAPIIKRLPAVLTRRELEKFFDRIKISGDGISNWRTSYADQALNFMHSLRFEKVDIFHKGITVSVPNEEMLQEARRWLNQMLADANGFCLKLDPPTPDKMDMFFAIMCIIKDNKNELEGKKLITIPTQELIKLNIKVTDSHLEAIKIRHAKHQQEEFERKKERLQKGEFQNLKLPDLEFPKLEFLVKPQQALDEAKKETTDLGKQTSSVSEFLKRPGISN